MTRASKSVATARGVFAARSATGRPSDHDVGVRCELAPPIAAHCYQRDIGLVVKQAGEPGINKACESAAERRPPQALVV
jgi:hypothetical protein